MAGYRRAAATGAAFGALALVVVAVALAMTGGGLGQWISRKPPTRALLILEGAGDQGVRVAHAVIDVDWSTRPARAVVVDPMSDVLVVGTSYRTMRDGFAFGGGEAVADAYSRLETGTVLPSVVLTSETWGGLVDSGGGVEISLDTSVQVFTGDRLYVFDAGTTKVRGEEVAPLLTGLDYRASTAEAAVVRADLSTLVIRELANVAWSRSPLADADRVGSLAGPTGEAALRELAAALAGATVSSTPRR